MGGGGKGGSDKQTLKTEPWGAAEGDLQSILEQARGLYQGPDVQRFPGSQVAPYNDMQRGVYGAMNRAAGQAGETLGAAGGEFNRTLAGEYLDQGNPHFSALRDRITADVMPGVNATFGGAGRTGSGLHQESLTRGLGDAMAPIEYANYEAERGRMVDAAKFSPVFAGALGTPGQLMQGGGDYQNALRQRTLDDKIEGFNFGQMSPYDELSRYLGVVGPIGGQFSASQQSGGGGGGGGAAGALGGAIGGAQVGSMIGGGPWGAGIGAIGGGLLGLFG